MVDAGKPQDEGLDKAQMKQYLVPALAVAAVIVLAGLVIYVSGGAARSMSDGSNGGVDDPDLKEAVPGVKFRDIKEGSGDPVPPGATVTVHYAGWRTDGEEFDNSKKRGKTADFPLKSGPGGVIAGWVAGIPGMKKGGIRKLVLAPEKAYGQQQKEGIPPGSTLIFEVELVDFVPPVKPKLFDGTDPTAPDPDLKDIGGGLKIRDLKEGSGEPVKEGAEVTMHYTGWLLNGTQFDSSRTRGKPLDALLKPGTQKSVIAGWNKGIPGMKPGGIRKLVIPPEMAYGDEGFSPDIPGGATLVFEVEVVK